MKPKAILFDMGGVLLDSVDDWDAEGFPISFPDGLPDPAPLDWFLGMSQEISSRFLAMPVPRRAMEVRPIIEAWLRNRQAEPTPEMVEHWYEILCCWEASPVYAFVRPTLETLRDMGFRLGVISNTLMPAGRIRRRFDEAGIRTLFEFTVFSAEFGANKPDPAIFRHALDSMALDAGDVWYVGDKPNRDVCGAHSVGMTAVLVDSAHHEHINDAPENIPDLRIEDISELPSLLKTLTR